MPLIEFKFNPFRSQTMRGLVVVILGVLYGHFDPNGVGGTLGPLVVQLIGLALGMFGIRNAIAKNGNSE